MLSPSTERDAPARTAEIVDQILAGQYQDISSAEARRHKVVPQVAELDGAALDDDDVRYAAIGAQVLGQAAAEIAAAMRPCGGALLLRGFAIGRHYQVVGRQFSDLDVAIRGLADLPPALRRLRVLGFRITRPIAVRPSRQGWWAAAALQRPGDGLPHPVYLDVVTPGPGIDALRHLPLGRADWDAAEEIEISGAPVTVPAPTSAMTLLAVELNERESIIARDVLDLRALHLAGASTARVAAALRGRRVRGGLRKLDEVLKSSAAAEGLRPVVQALMAVSTSGTGRPRRASRTAAARPGYDDAVRPAEVRRRLRHGAPVYGFPDADGRLPGLAGGSTHPGLAGLTLRARPIARAEEIDYSIPPLPATTAPGAE